MYFCIVWVKWRVHTMAWVKANATKANDSDNRKTNNTAEAGDGWWKCRSYFSCFAPGPYVLRKATCPTLPGQHMSEYGHECSPRRKTPLHKPGEHNQPRDLCVSIVQKKERQKPGDSECSSRPQEGVRPAVEALYPWLQTRKNIRSWKHLTRKCNHPPLQ